MAVATGGPGGEEETDPYEVVERGGGSSKDKGSKGSKQQEVSVLYLICMCSAVTAGGCFGVTTPVVWCSES